LQPAERALNLALGLRRKGVGNPNLERAHHLAPLGINIIGLEHMIAPDAIPFLNKAKKRVNYRHNSN